MCFVLQLSKLILPTQNKSFGHFWCSTFVRMLPLHMLIAALSLWIQCSELQQSFKLTSDYNRKLEQTHKSLQMQ